MNKTNLTKIFAIVITLSLLLSNGLMLGLKRTEAVGGPSISFYQNDTCSYPSVSSLTVDQGACVKATDLKNNSKYRLEIYNPLGESVLYKEKNNVNNLGLSFTPNVCETWEAKLSKLENNRWKEITIQGNTIEVTGCETGEEGDDDDDWGAATGCIFFEAEGLPEELGSGYYIKEVKQGGEEVCTYTCPTETWTKTREVPIYSDCPQGYTVDLQDESKCIKEETKWACGIKESAGKHGKYSCSCPTNPSYTYTSQSRAEKNCSSYPSCSVCPHTSISTKTRTQIGTETETYSVDLVYTENENTCVRPSYEDLNPALPNWINPTDYEEGTDEELEGKEECTFNGEIRYAPCVPETEPNQPITIIANKIICSDVNDLPRWGDGEQTIDSNTAQDYVGRETSCEIVEGWEFEWAFEGVENPGDNSGYGGEEWNTFSAGESVEIKDLGESSIIWVREVLKDGYIGFAGVTTTLDEGEHSAGLYCYTDALHYDNYDFIDNPAYGNTYYCVAFNAPTEIIEEEETTTTTTTTIPSSGGGPTGSYIPSQEVSGGGSSSGEGIVAGAACIPYLHEYIQYGANNDPFEVRKLQIFLNGYLGLNLDVNGIYDLDTFNAVKTFQTMLKDDILAPWVVNGCLSSEELATGYVYRTTRWAINNIFCPEMRPDVSDETCFGFGEGLVLGESIALADDGSMPEGDVLDTPVSSEQESEEEVMEISEIEELETTEPGETEEGAKTNQGAIIALLAVLALGGLAYFIFRGKRV